MTAKSTDLVIVKFDYKPTDIHELGIQKGERLTLLDDTQHWWRVMNAQGATGYVPSNYVKRSKQGIFSSLRNTLGRRKSRQEDNNGVVAKHGSVESLGHKYSQPNQTLDNLNSGGFPLGDSSRATSTFHQYSSSASATDAPEPVQRPPGGFDVSYDVSQDGPPRLAPDAWGSMGNRHHNSSQALSSVPSRVTGNDMSGPRQNGHNELSPSSTAVTSQPADLQLRLQLHQQPQQAQLQHTASMDPNPYFGTGSGLGRHICQALFAYPASQPDELSIERGDKIRVLEKSSDGWWRGVLVTEGRPALMGWFPSNYVTLDLTKNLSRAGSTSQPNSLNSSSLGRGPKESLVSHTTMTMQAQLQAQLLAQQYQSSKTVLQPGANVPTTLVGTEFKSGYRPVRETVLTLYPFVRNQIEEMSFEANEVLDVLDKPVDDPDWWRCRNARGETGLVPRNYVRVLNPAVSATATASSATITSTSMTSITTGAATTTTTTATAVGAASALTLDAGRHGPPGLEPLGIGQARADGDALRLNYALRSNTARAHVNQPWCWGAISRAECEAMLGQYSRPGEFIIRDSESHPGDLTVTINAGSKTRNFKVHVENDQYHIGQKVFASIQDLIEHYRNHPIFKNDQEKHYLTRPFVHPGLGLPEAGRPVPNPNLSTSYVHSAGVMCQPVGGMQPRYS